MKRIRIGNIYFADIKELKTAITEGKVVGSKDNNLSDYRKMELNQVTDRYFYSIAKEKGDYLNMGEIIHDAQAGDPDATFLKQLYDAIWAKEEELEAELEQMTLDQLLELDLEAWAKEAYDQVKAELEQK
jgi:2-hydroxychromene-2-carboxylate isomerase